METILLPDTLSMIPDHMFESCRNLKTIKLPGKLQLIDQEGFRGSGLQRVTIPKGVCKIAERAFCCCEELQSVDFENGSRLEDVGFQAFCDAGLTSFSTPSSLRKIGGMAFGDCPHLQDFRLN